MSVDCRVNCLDALLLAMRFRRNTVFAAIIGWVTDTA